MQVVKLAMIGCGRAAESLHLPAAAVSGNVETELLVDTDLSRARQLAQAYGVTEVRESVTEAARLADAAVVALPHHLHAPVSRELLESGVHVLVEKPLALAAAECDELGELARRQGLVLAVGMIRRTFPAARYVKRVLERELLGQVVRVEVREGVPFSWRVASDFTFRPETGGGVLADAGIHLLDLLGWWFGEVVVTACRDDARGGVEADAEVDLRLPSGAPVFVEMSRTRELSNEVVITGERGMLRAGTGFDAQLTLDLGEDPFVGTVRPRERELHNVRQLFARQLESFVEAVRGGRSSGSDGARAREQNQASPGAQAFRLVGAKEAARAVRLLEECRSLRQPLDLPWESFPGDVEAAA